MNREFEGRLKLGATKAAVLFSGGKDSTYACAKAVEREYLISCLLTIVSENKESYMLHTPNIELTELSARAMGIPLRLSKTLGKKEDELSDIKRAISQAKTEFGFGTLITGAIASRYQKNRLERIAQECGLELLSPLWGFDQDEYLRTLVSEGYKFVITSVSAAGLDKNWLGRMMDRSEIENLISLSKKYGFNPALEGGEGETFVLDCPLFNNGRIKVLNSNTEWNGYFGSYRINKAILVEK